MLIAEERLQGTGISCYNSPGNDETLGIDEALSSSIYLVNTEEQVVSIDDYHEITTLRHTNHMPWNSPRETDEDVLEQKIYCTASLEIPSNAIWNTHVPPIDTPIDQAPKLDPTLKTVFSGGQMVMMSTRSMGTRRTIENITINWIARTHMNRNASRR